MAGRGVRLSAYHSRELYLDLTATDLAKWLRVGGCLGSASTSC
jgi:hypothetical protein